jgi:molybdopterin molybdotransferase
MDEVIMAEFLKLVPPADALQVFLANLSTPTLRTERIATPLCLGRVTAVATKANQPLPAFDRSTVDGFAVHAEDTYGASDSMPAYLPLAADVPMGAAPGFPLKSAQAARIYTGGMLPAGANAVVMMETTQEMHTGEVEIFRQVAPGENIILTGEDVKPGDEVIPAGHKIRPADLGGLLALGLTNMEVVVSPRIGILSSGDEVIPPEQTPEPGQVRDINSHSLAAMITQQGGIPRHFGIVPDQADILSGILRQALQECDAVVITAGSSASTRDLTSGIIQSMGAPGVLVQGVNVRPGKPTILAVCNGKPVIGLPGNPVSAMVIARLFVLPIINHLLGIQHAPPIAGVTARLTTHYPSQAGREDWVPVRLITTEHGYDAEPVFYKSNLIFQLVSADGLAKITADSTGLTAGESVWVEMI